MTKKKLIDTSANIVLVTIVDTTNFGYLSIEQANITLTLTNKIK